MSEDRSELRAMTYDQALEERQRWQRNQRETQAKQERHQWQEASARQVCNTILDYLLRRVGHYEAAASGSAVCVIGPWRGWSKTTAPTAPVIVRLNYHAEHVEFTGPVLDKVDRSPEHWRPEALAHDDPDHDRKLFARIEDCIKAHERKPPAHPPARTVPRAPGFFTRIGKWLDGDL